MASKHVVEVLEAGETVRVGVVLAGERRVGALHLRVGAAQLDAQHLEVVLRRQRLEVVEQLAAPLDGGVVDLGAQRAGALCRRVARVGAGGRRRRVGRHRGGDRRVSGRRLGRRSVRGRHRRGLGRPRVRGGRGALGVLGRHRGGRRFGLRGGRRVVRCRLARRRLGCRLLARVALFGRDGRSLEARRLVRRRRCRRRHRSVQARAAAPRRGLPRPGPWPRPGSRSAAGPAAEDGGAVCSDAGTVSAAAGTGRYSRRPVSNRPSSVRSVSCGSSGTSSITSRAVIAPSTRERM